MKHFRAWFLVGISALLFLSIELSAQMSFKKVEGRTAYGRAKEGQKGTLIVNSDSIRFVNNKNPRDAYFSIPSNAISDVFYSRVSGRRIKTAIFLTGPVGLFLKGKKHYMTLSFDDGGDIVGAVEFKLDKKNYRGVMRAVEQVSGVELVFDQEGIKDEKETVASRSGARRSRNGDQLQPRRRRDRDRRGFFRNYTAHQETRPRRVQNQDHHERLQVLGEKDQG